MKKGNLWLTIGSFVVALFGVGANLVLDVVSRSNPQGTISDGWFYSARVIALVAASVPGLFGLFLASYRYEKSERERQRREDIDYMQTLLEGSVRRLFPSENLSLIRANIMVAREGELKVLAQWNMEAYPDSRMSLVIGKGVAGKVWERATVGKVDASSVQPLYAPNAQLTRRALKKKWKLNDDEIEMTRHILWIFSTPIIIRQGESMTFQGVFNLDGVSAYLNNMTVFGTSDFQGNSLTTAELIGSQIVNRNLSS